MLIVEGTIIDNSPAANGASVLLVVEVVCVFGNDASIEPSAEWGASV